MSVFYCGECDAPAECKDNPEGGVVFVRSCDHGEDKPVFSRDKPPNVLKVITTDPNMEANLTGTSSLT